MNHSRGFTVIEMMVTVIVAAILIISINVLYTAITRASSSERSRADASDVAYSKLRTYVYNGANAPASFNCATGDLTVNPNAAGTTLVSGLLTSADTTIPQPVTYKVIAYSPYGCSGANADSPLLIRSTVTFGSPAQTIVHSAYVGNK